VGYATCNGELLGVGKGVIGDVCSALRKAALMRVSAPVHGFASCQSKCEGRRRVELDRGKKRLERKANYEKPAERAAPSLFEVTKTYCRLNNLQWDGAKEGRQ
jgi:hypothetical protein